MKRLKGFREILQKSVCTIAKWIAALGNARIYFAKSPAAIQSNAIIFFPVHTRLICCGIAGIVSFISKKASSKRGDIETIEKLLARIRSDSQSMMTQKEPSVADSEDCRTRLLSGIQVLKEDAPFIDIFEDVQLQERLATLGRDIRDISTAEEKWLFERMGVLQSEIIESVASGIEKLKDASWLLISEIVENISKVKTLLTLADQTLPAYSVLAAKKINTVLNSIDKLEVRGRDSAGISLMFFFENSVFEAFKKTIDEKHLTSLFEKRSTMEYLNHHGIDCRKATNADPAPLVSVALTYKIAAEIGKLGDNVLFLRNQIRTDPVFSSLVLYPHRFFTVVCHTRWASVGAITEANCHPVDNQEKDSRARSSGVIHVCLNGDIDNYLELKKVLDDSGIYIHPDISTDTKIIPLQIEGYLRRGFEIPEAFRLAVNDFKGSHAIAMHTDLAPGKLFLAQRGSGQAIFVGIAPDHYMATSEVYGFVEETPVYLKLDGEREIEGKSGKTKGQIFILDQSSAGGLSGINAVYYDGTALGLSDADVKRTKITSRDIDRQGFPHYFLKEISESPQSVEKTLQNRWKIEDTETRQHSIRLETRAFPASLSRAFETGRIRRIFFIGQGTAGVAAAACAEIFNYYLNDSRVSISALKASELSGFRLEDDGSGTDMSDTLIVAISQSGTTTDTNRTVDMVRVRGAHTLAIVNRRDSDITFKTDGVLYTSSGRDIEMSVASTKAFYSQIVAGALLGLQVAALTKRRDAGFISREIQELLRLPEHMKKVFSLKNQIAESAGRLAVTKTYWAAVGSGPNKVSADEIRIKLSELCYKTISSDFVEDKKHIDLSSEPLIIVCAAGTKTTVLGDIVKDTAIFHAHKATPIVITDEGEHRFDPYAADVFHVPMVGQHLSPILNTLVGHIWGYFAALAINEGSRFLFDFRESIQQTIHDHVGKGLDIYELVLEKSFREQIAYFYNAFRKKKAERRISSTIGFDTASELPLLLKYLTGRLPVTEFELDFGLKGTAANMLNTLFQYLGDSINQMARPVDAIKHQAKTVTVGTSRIREKVEGVLFDAIAEHQFAISQLTNKNVLVLKNLQAVLHHIKGWTLYRIDGLNLLGEPTDRTTIEILGREGSSREIVSRVEKDPKLKGTKRIIVQEGNVYIGKGRKDGRSILIIPLLSLSSNRTNAIEYLFLLDVAFKPNALLQDKIKALGGKYERIQNIVQENSLPWENGYLDAIETEELFGISAEKIGEQIVARFKNAG